MKRWQKVLLRLMALALIVAATLFISSGFEVGWALVLTIVFLAHQQLVLGFRHIALARALEQIREEQPVLGGPRANFVASAALKQDGTPVSKWRRR